jgi:hypothetical protein
MKLSLILELFYINSSALAFIPTVAFKLAPRMDLGGSLGELKRQIQAHKAKATH